MSHHHGHDHEQPSDDPTVRFSAAFWDERYRSGETKWSGSANPHLVSVADALTPGSALDAGSGDGSDAIWLASHGWQVTGVDVSQVALDLAVARAREAGPGVAERIRTEQADFVAGWDPAPRMFDLVSAQFMHLELPAMRALHQVLAGAVRPGGTLLIVLHDPSDLETSIRRPPGDTFVTAEQVAEVLYDGWPEDSWDVTISTPAREGRDPDGNTVTIHDALLVAVRRA